MNANNRLFSMVSASNACPRCNGSGNTGHRNANGVCFKCNGTGLLGSTNLEASAVIASYRNAPVAPIVSTPVAIDSDDSGEWLTALFNA